MIDFNCVNEYGLYPIIEVKELYKYKLSYLKLIEEMALLKKENELLKLYLIKAIHKDFIPD